MTATVTDEQYLELAEAAGEGAWCMDAFDVRLPEAERWYWIVNPETLDMSQSTGGHRRKCGCIFGQHSPSGFYAPSEYGLDTGIPLGFDIPLTFGTYDVRADGYAVLAELWVEEINDRRAAYFEQLDRVA